MTGEILAKNGRNKEPISFVNEHTVEYILVQKLANVLKEKTYAFIFPHQTREGSTISRAIHQQDFIRIIGIFPRRPKLRTAGANEIYFKINKEVIHSVIHGKAHNIPFISGCPISKNFWDLGERVVWLRLQNIEEEKTICVDTANIELSLKKIGGALDGENGLIDYIDSVTNSYDIETAMSVIRDIYNCSGMNRYLFGTVYKPFYIFIKSV
jgi:hypothetical protein